MYPACLVTTKLVHTFERTYSHTTRRPDFDTFPFSSHRAVGRNHGHRRRDPAPHRRQRPRGNANLRRSCRHLRILDSLLHRFFTNSVTIINSYMADNQETGVEFLEDPTFVEGTLQTNSNVICGNVEGGYESFDDSASNAEGNWWGAATGPTHPSNPAGTGDDVVDGTNGQLGTVDFDPFITTSSGSGSATVGLASTISFQFTGPGGTPVLGEGPGDETGDSPFSVTTDNGTATVGFITGGKLEVSLTAETVGTANVTVAGPCGLASATLPVAVADVAATPTPAGLPERGGAAHASDGLPLTTVVALIVFTMAAMSAAGFAWTRAH